MLLAECCGHAMPFLSDILTPPWCLEWNYFLFGRILTMLFVTICHFHFLSSLLTVPISRECPITGPVFSSDSFAPPPFSSLLLLSLSLCLSPLYVLICTTFLDDNATQGCFVALAGSCRIYSAPARIPMNGWTNLGPHRCTWPRAVMWRAARGFWRRWYTPVGTPISGQWALCLGTGTAAALGIFSFWSVARWMMSHLSPLIRHEPAALIRSYIESRLVWGLSLVLCKEWWWWVIICC